MSYILFLSFLCSLSQLIPLLTLSLFSILFSPHLLLSVHSLWSHLNIQAKSHNSWHRPALYHILHKPFYIETYDTLYCVQIVLNDNSRSCVRPVETMAHLVISWYQSIHLFNHCGKVYCFNCSEEMWISADCWHLAAVQTRRKCRKQETCDYLKIKAYHSLPSMQTV